MNSVWLVLLSLLSSVAFQSAPRRAALQGDADFLPTSRKSHVQGAYVIHNQIKNNHLTKPLTVKWVDGGIMCAGSSHLKPGGTVIAGGPAGIFTSLAPVYLHNSAVRYGALLQYSASASVYIVPQLKDPFGQTTQLSATVSNEFKQLNADNQEVFRVIITSTLDEARRASEIGIQIPEGYALAIPGIFGKSLATRQSLSAESSGWGFAFFESAQDLSLSAVSLTAFASDWLRIGAIAEDSITRLQRVRDGDMSVAATGIAWTLQDVPVVVYPPDRDGVIGMMASLHVPVAPSGMR